MKTFYRLGILALLFSFVTSCNGNAKDSGQHQPADSTVRKVLVGGRCEDCNLMYEGMPSNLNATDTSGGWTENGQKLLVTGTVYQKDGKTPAPNIILYYWQTDDNGYYSPKEGMDEQAKRHGHIRGWVKTDEQGQYAIYTIRPAPYPNTNNPAHIHPLIKEPDIDNEYYIDDFVFDDDTLLTDDYRKRLENRGGSGILKVSESGEMQIAKRDIVLGWNIPDYPEKQ